MRHDHMMSALARLNPVPLGRDVTLLDEPARAAAFARSLARARASAEAPRRRRLPTAVLAALIALAVAAPAVAVGRDAIADLFRVSNRGDDVSRGSLSEVSALSARGFGSEMRLLGERAGFRFYVGRSAANGGPCFAVTAAPAPGRGGAYACQQQEPPAGTPQFPSPQVPIADFSPRRGHAERPEVFVRALAGFAADGVARVGVVFPDGETYWTTVEQNVYASREVPQRPASAIVAEDASGAIVHRYELVGETP
jgi:hypothetical protein